MLYKFFEVVLNLIINGIPSILDGGNTNEKIIIRSFKPYYKWNTFNTVEFVKSKEDILQEVLNLIINGIPSILSW